MTRLLVFLAVVEGLTGLIVFVSPPVVTRLLFDADVAGAGASMTRLTGVSLMALAAACWPDGDTRRAFIGMLTYNLLATLLLGWIGASGDVGMLLWPAVAAHAGISLLLVRAWRQARRGSSA